MRKTIEAVNPTVLCVQEASERSIEADVDDFDFMGSEYGRKIIKNGRMRCITFYKVEEVEVIEREEGDSNADFFSKDRTLVVPFLRKKCGCVFWVVNCHLTAGPNGDRRLRQVSDALEHIRKQAKILQVTVDNIVVCGDFNSDDGEFPAVEVSAITDLLKKGATGKNFTELGEIVTKKGKKQGFGQFYDAYEEAFNDTMPPPTLILPSLIPRFIADGGNCGGDEAAIVSLRKDSVQMTQGLRNAVDTLFEHYAGGAEKGEMTRESVEKWLVDINGEVGRGSEYRSAMEFMKKNLSEGLGDVLSKEDMQQVYLRELEGSKFWGVAYDLRKVLGESKVLRGVLPDYYIESRRPNSDETGAQQFSANFFTARFDKILFCGLRLVAVMETVGGGGDCLPNGIEPSDHLPVAGWFNIE